MTDKQTDLLTEVATNQKHLMKELVAHVAEEREWKKEMVSRQAEHGERLGSLERDAYINRKVWRIMKITGGVIVLLLTLKFGDIPALFEGLK
jgi:hypothetical protein